MVQDEPTSEELRTELIIKSNDSCCICQNPFIHAHHIDFNSQNDVFDNLAPLCPNHHSLAHTKSSMTLNLTQERIKAIRDKWYDTCENRRQVVVQVINREFEVSKLKENVQKTKPITEFLSQFSQDIVNPKELATKFLSFDRNSKIDILGYSVQFIIQNTLPEHYKIFIEEVMEKDDSVLVDLSEIIINNLINSGNSKLNLLYILNDLTKYEEVKNLIKTNDDLKTVILAEYKTSNTYYESGVLSSILINILSALNNAEIISIIDYAISNSQITFSYNAHDNINKIIAHFEGTIPKEKIEKYNSLWGQ